MNSAVSHGYKIEVVANGEHVGCIRVIRWEGEPPEQRNWSHHFFDYPLRRPFKILWWEIESCDVSWYRNYDAKHPEVWTWCESVDDAIPAAAHFICTGEFWMPPVDQSTEDRIAVELALMDGQRDA